MWGFKHWPTACESTIGVSYGVRVRIRPLFEHPDPADRSVQAELAEGVADTVRSQPIRASVTAT